MSHLDAARMVCKSEKQARIIANIMREQKLPASPVTAMNVLDETIIPATQNSHILSVTIRERFEM